MRIRSLEMRARIVVEGFWSGIHRSPYHGFSAEFSEYRQYAPGDDVRHIDWRVFARSDRYFIKKFEDETNLRCQLLVDGSRSMMYGSDPAVTKHHYAATLAATLACFLSRQGDAVGVTRFDDKVRDYLPPRNRPGHLRRLMLALEKPPEGRTTDLGGPLERVAQMHGRRGMFILLTDLLAPLDILESRLGFLRARGHEVLVFQILDPRELDFGFEDAAQFTDLESGRQQFIDPEEARAAYRQRLEAHLATAGAICQRAGIDYYLSPTDRPLDLALFDLLTSRSHRAARPSRRNANLGKAS
ncbi:MAG: DUF58 domain-containing protein [Akkermansiaceae bacterium]|nr:DUF58 domain-containing protein [Akkermansiaceae bacterium]NNM31278.1 DUF58 domain-containing protein [Akkermansiaceae bacterium]